MERSERRREPRVKRAYRSLQNCLDYIELFRNGREREFLGITTRYFVRTNRWFGLTLTFVVWFSLKENQTLNLFHAEEWKPKIANNVVAHDNGDHQKQ